MGWSPDEPITDVVELAPGQTADLGSAQQRSGFLGEASGIEALLRALSTGHERALIEVRRGGQALAWLFVDRIAAHTPQADPPARIPLPARFSTTDTTDTPAPTPQASPSAASAASATRAQAPCPPAPQPAPIGVLAPLAEVHELADTLTRALQLRTRILGQLLHLDAPLTIEAGKVNPGGRPPGQVVRREARNVLLRDVTGPASPQDASAEAAAWRATVIVDEQHPYYFDHALDHVPGILLLEAALQMAELVTAAPSPADAAPHQATRQAERQVTRLGVRFRRYTEKQAPIALTARLRTPDTLLVQIGQHGASVCEIELGLGVLPARAAQAVAPAQTGLPEPKWLHKVRPENRLVHELEQREGQWGVVTAPLPAHHALGDGASTDLSMLYFLEVARQCFMLVAHGQLAVPLGTPMNLIDLRFTLTAPIPRDTRLWLAPHYNPAAWQGSTRTSQVTIGLHDAQGAIGEACIVSQAIAPEAYRAQRQAEHA